MGLYPEPASRLSFDCRFPESSIGWGGVPQTIGLTLPENGRESVLRKLKTLYVVGANQSGVSLSIRLFFRQSFVVVQDMFLTETAVLADVVLPGPTPMRNRAHSPTLVAIFSW